MTREQIIQGLQFTIDMFLFDPTTGEEYTEPRNDMDKTTIDACKGAIELLKQQPCEDAISREAVLSMADYVGETPTHSNPYAKLEEVVRVKDIIALPPVQSKQRVGHWIYDKRIENWKCSECGCSPKTIGYVGRVEFMREHFKFCNHCGAKMIEPQAESEE